MQNTQPRRTHLEESLEKYQLEKDSSPQHWLREGANYFGSAPSNQIVFPGESVAPFAGILFLKEDKVLLRVAAGQQIIQENRSVDNILVYSGGVSLILQYNSIKFRIMCEEGRYYLSIFYMNKL